MFSILRMYFRGGLVANEVGVLEGTTSTNELAYGGIGFSQGRCPKLVKKSYIRKRVRKKVYCRVVLCRVVKVIFLV